MEQIEARSIPTGIAVCPICGASLWIEAINEYEFRDEDETSILPTDVGFTCETEPDIDQEQWQEWFNGHFPTPYIDWLPVGTRILEWLSHSDQRERLEAILGEKRGILCSRKP